MNFEILVNTINQTHQHFQQQASKAVNISLTLRNWLIGFYIIEFELHGDDRAVYGDKLFEELASRLKTIKGIDRRSLYRFKDFYTLYPQIAQYIGSGQASLFMPVAFSNPIVGSATPQSNKSHVPAEKILSNLSYSHIEQEGKARADYGKKVLKNLAHQLTIEFGKGFDYTNLTNMRKFYKSFPILDTLRQELSWSHYCLLCRLDSEKKIMDMKQLKAMLV